MRAVILAAGKGERLVGARTVPKPLVPVRGATLLARTIDALVAAGVREVTIVVGFRGDQIRAAVERPGIAAGVRVTGVDNPRFDLANGVSALAARDFAAGGALLTMCDHLLSPSLVLRVAAAHPPPGGLVLGVDRRVGDVFDLDDATKVATSGDCIAAIAKDLAAYDAIDTGVFHVTSGLFEELAAAFALRGDCSLSDGVRALAARGLARVVDTGDAFWLDVDTPAALAHAESGASDPSLTLRAGAP